MLESKKQILKSSIEAFFDGVIVRGLSNGLKFNVVSLKNEGIKYLQGMIINNTVEIKRSGTGLVIIIT